MVWIGSLIVIGQVASHTGIWRIAVITLVTGVAINSSMSAGEGIVVAMDRECSRRPAGVRCMTGNTGGWNAQSTVIRVVRLVVIGEVAAHTGIRRIVVIALVATVTVNGCMCAGERVIIIMNGESGGSPSGICGMTGFTCCWDPGCCVVWIGRLVIICQMTSHAGVGCIGIDTSRMTTVAINICVSSREGIIIIVDRKGCRVPSRVGGMTGFTGGWYLQGRVIWIGGLVIIVQMATDANDRCVIIDPAGMATVAVDCCMSAGKRVIIDVNSKSGWLPPWDGSMACFTGSWYLQGRMIWIGCLVVIILVTSHTYVGCIVIIIGRMATDAIRCRMSSCEGIIICMDGKNCRLPSWVCGVTICTGFRNGQGNMIGIGRLVISR